MKYKYIRRVSIAGTSAGILRGQPRWCVSPLQEPPPQGRLQEPLRGRMESLPGGRYSDHLWAILWRISTSTARLGTARLGLVVFPLQLSITSAAVTSFTRRRATL